MAPAVAALERLALPAETAPGGEGGGTPLPAPGNLLPLALADQATAVAGADARRSALGRPADEAPDDAAGEITAVTLALPQPVDASVPPVAVSGSGVEVMSESARPAVAVPFEAPDAPSEPRAVSPHLTEVEAALTTAAADEADGATEAPPPVGRETAAAARSGLDLTMPEMASRVRSVRPRMAREDAAARIEAAFGLRAEPTAGAEPGVTGPEGPGLILPSTEVIEVRTPAAALVGPPLRLDGAKWQEQFVQRLTLAMNDGLREARVIVDPPELGPLDMKIGMSGGETQVQFTAYHASTRELLEEAMPRLREMFDAAGLKLADADVRQGGQDGGNAERFERGAGSGGRGAEGDHELAGTLPSPRRVTHSLLDVYA